MVILVGHMKTRWCRSEQKGLVSDRSVEWFPLASSSTWRFDDKNYFVVETVP